MRTLLPLIALLVLSPAIVSAGTTELIIEGQTPVMLPASGLPNAVQKIADNVHASLKSDHPFSKSLPLINPPEWGKTISESTHGSVDFQPQHDDVFLCHLSLAGLEPNHPYKLTLNGRPDLLGNDLLPTAVPGLPDERFYDFLDIRADAHGAYESTLAIKLKPGEYDVRIYVKDTSDWKIVLYRDYFRFDVK